MGTLDFLFGGKPPPNTAAQGGTQSLPQWYSDATMQGVNKANAIYNNDVYTPSPIPTVAPATDRMKQSWDTVDKTAGKYNPAMEGALTATEGIAPTANKGYDAASGAVTGGMQKFTGQNVNDYMNPYIDRVVNRGRDLAMENWNENMLPGLNSMFVGAGQSLGNPNAAVAYRGARDVTRDIQNNADSQYAGAYDTAGSNFRADQERGMRGGMDLASITNDRARTGLDAAAQTGTLAQNAQSMGYRDAAAKDAAGNEERGIIQQSLTAGNAEFDRQNNFQKDNLDRYMAAIQGIPHSSSSTYTGPAQVEGTSPAGMGVGATAGMQGLWPAARGGLAQASAAKRDIPGWLKEALLELLDKHSAA